MPEYGKSSSRFSKGNIRFEGSTFEIRYVRNFVKTRKVIRFGAKCPYLSSKVWKTNVRFETNTFGIGHRQNCDKTTKLRPFGPTYPNMEIWA